jgi:hypothetical protein
MHVMHACTNGRSSHRGKEFRCTPGPVLDRIDHELGRIARGCGKHSATVGAVAFNTVGLPIRRPVFPSERPQDCGPGRSIESSVLHLRYSQCGRLACMFLAGAAVRNG